MWLCIGLAAVWLMLGLYARWQRRAYNLTHAEKGRGGVQPDFLKVDHAKREAALERGRPAAEPVVAVQAASRYSRLAGLAATVFAVLTLLVAVLKAVTSLDEYTAMASEAVELVTNTEAMGAVLRDYWPGLLVALAVVLVQVGKFVSTLKKT